MPQEGEMSEAILKNFDAIDEEKSDWLLDLATSKLKATYDVSCDLDRKATALLAGCTAILCAIVGYGVTQYKIVHVGLGQYVLQTGWLWAGALCMAVGAGFLLWQLMSSDIHLLGCRPSTLMNSADGYIHQSLIDIKNGYLEEMELRIGDNLEWTRNRTFALDFAIVMITLAPFIAGLVGVIF
jgi:hypothetical protein